MRPISLGSDSKKQNKCHPKTDYDVPDGEQGIALPLTSALDGSG